MNIDHVRAFLLCTTIINYAILLVWFLAFVFAHDALYRIHARWFRFSPESFDAIHYGSMAVYKVGIMLFGLVPLIALSLA